MSKPVISIGIMGCTLLLTISLSGCFATGAQHRPIVDGGDLVNYDVDLEQCQEVAEQRELVDEETKTGALIGAVVGALAGIGEGKGETLAGAAVGALIGGGSNAYEAIKERKKIVIRCMQSRGYNVVESTH